MHTRQSRNPKYPDKTTDGQKEVYRRYEETKPEFYCRGTRLLCHRGNNYKTMQVVTNKMDCIVLTSTSGYTRPWKALRCLLPVHVTSIERGQDQSQRFCFHLRGLHLWENSASGRQKHPGYLSISSRLQTSKAHFKNQVCTVISDVKTCQPSLTDITLDALQTHDHQHRKNSKSYKHTNSLPSHHLNNLKLGVFLESQYILLPYIFQG